MPTTATQIANLALSSIGGRSISNLETEDSVEATSCRLHFDLVRDSLLQTYQWSFGTHRATLSQLETPPASEWAHAWQLPLDCQRLIRIVGSDPHLPLTSFAREGRSLLTNQADTEGSLHIVYVSNLTPIAQWDPLFIKAMQHALAAEIAQDVTSDADLANNALQKLNALSLPAAKSADAKEVRSGENFGVHHMIAKSSLSRIRHGGPTLRPTSLPGE